MVVFDHKVYYNLKKKNDLGHLEFLYYNNLEWFQYVQNFLGDLSDL